MESITDKRYLIQKTSYNIPNQYILEFATSKLDKRYYNVKIYDKGKYYLVIATPKIESI